MKGLTEKASVVTPEEDLAGCALDWRYLTAVALAGNPPRKTETADDVIATWLLYLRQDRRLSMKERERVAKVRSWHQGPLADVLRPLLLTDENYGDIATRLGLKTADVVLYETSFFNVRLPSGELRPRLLLGARFNRDDSVPGLPLRAALQAGVAGVEASFGVCREEGDVRDTKSAAWAIKALAKQQLLSRLMTGQVATRDLVRIAQLEEMERAAKVASNAVEDEYLDTIQKLLSLCAPEREPVEAYAPHLRDKTSADSQRAAQSKVDKFGAKGGAAPLKKPVDYDPVKAKRNTENYKRDMQDLRVAGPDGKPVLAFPGS